MLAPDQLTLHGLILKQLASAEQLANVIGIPVVEVAARLGEAVASGHVVVTLDKHTITSAGRAALEAAYPVALSSLRRSAEVQAAMDAFESSVNQRVLELTTEWQTKASGAGWIINDHSDLEYDAGVIDRIALAVDETNTVLAPIATTDPLVSRFLDRIATAVIRAEGGEANYVSGMRVDSVHSVWLQMHEHLLRLTGRERTE